MPSPEILKDLLERVRKAEGPDRVIDADVCIALEPGASSASTGYPHTYRTGRVEPVHGRAIFCDTPDLTNSLDACLSLLGKLGFGWRKPNGSNNVAVWDMDQVSGSFYEEIGDCPTVPLSLLMAALKLQLRKEASREAVA